MDKQNTNEGKARSGKFVINEERGTVTYLQKYGGHIVSAKAKVNEGEKFDVELGKALAFARCELKIREQETKGAEIVSGTVYANLLVSEDQATSRGFERLFAVTCATLNKQRHYLANQRKMVRMIAKGKFAGTCDEILQAAHDTVCK